MMRSSISVLAFCILAGVASATAPAISGVTAGPVNDTWAQIGWQTDIAANSEVDFGPTASYGSTVSNSALATTHKLQIDNLTSATLYHYRVRSTNGSSETSVSGDATFTTVPAMHGCESNPTGEPIGGGVGYSRIYTPAEATVVVSTAAQLLSAISSATAGTIIYVDDSAQIDLTAQTSAIMVPGGVTIASGRGRNGSVGGLLFTNLFAARHYMFQSGGNGVRFTGLRISGPYYGTGRTIPYSYGVTFAHNDCEIDNCEVMGFNLASVASSGNVTGMRVHHNYIHHNQRCGWGYGVACYTSKECLVEGNLFDYTRHAVASSGVRPASYEARYNLYMDNSISHIFDMHGANDFEKTIMQGNWRFDESAGTTAYDSSEYGVGDATLHNFNAPACWVEGKIIHALQFDGVDDYVDCGDNSMLAGSSFSVTAWIKPAAVSGTQAIASRGDTLASGYGYSLRLVGSTLEGIVHNSSGTIATAATNSGTIPAGVWTHVAMTFNGSTATLYINGASAKTFSCGGVRQSASLHFIIGRDAGGTTSSFGGTLDEVRCYSSCLTADDVLRHANLQGDVAGDTIRIHHNTVRCIDQSAVTIRGVPTVGCWVNNNWYWRAYDSLIVRQINAYGNMFVSDNNYGLETPAPDPAGGTMLAEWRFDEGTGTTTADSSGHGRTGTLTNMSVPSCWVAGKSGTALAFDGVNDYVACGSSLTQTDNIAIDLWVKFDKFAEYTSLFTNGLFEIYNRSGWAGNKLYFLCKINENAMAGDSAWVNKTGVKSTTELTTGTWYRVSCVRAGNRMRIFINNRLERELNCLDGFTIGSPSLLKIGTNPFKGVVDEAKVFTPGPEHPGNHAPTLTWTGEANFGADGLNSQSGTMADQFTFRVKYTDADGDEPRLGYPKLHLLRGGVEFEYATPLSMFAVDDTTVSTGRIYTCTVKLPRGADYTYQFEAIDQVGMIATGAATTPAPGPAVTSGNTAPVLMFTDETNFVEQGHWPNSGTSDTSFDFRAKYFDADNDPPQAGYPRVRIMRGGFEIPGSPFTMTAVDSASYLVGRKYQLLKKLTAATDYSYQFIAMDANGLSADPSVVANYPDVTAGTDVWTELYSTATNPTAGSIPVQVVFSQSVTGFAQGDVTVTNGTISGFSGSGASYSFTVTPSASGVVTVNIAAGVCTNGTTTNLAATQLSRVFYPAAGADDIWIGHGYPGARLGTITDPFDLIADGIPWLKTNGTMHILSGTNPETIRLTKPMRVQSQGGTATIGRNSSE
ncbi:Ig-like domain-containing protein [bacterium]|nr:Ig-like domain-containing protein [bacterium]